MELMHGRPDDCAIRQPREVRTYDFLDALGISYLRVDHAPAETMEDCIAVDEAMGTQMCKNLFLCNRQKTAFYLLMMPGDKRFRTKELSAQLGVSRLSFAEDCYMQQYLDILPGAVSVLGLINDVEQQVSLLVDRDLLKAPAIGCHPCVNTSSLRLEQKDLWEKILPATKHSYQIVDLKGEEDG